MRTLRRPHVISYEEENDVSYQNLKGLGLLCLACLALTACESANIENPKPRENVFGGRGAGAGGGDR